MYVIICCHGLAFGVSFGKSCSYQRLRNHSISVDGLVGSYLSLSFATQSAAWLIAIRGWFTLSHPHSALAQNDGRSLSHSLLVLEDVLMASLPRIATLENRIDNRFKRYDDKIGPLETSLDRELQRRRLADTEVPAPSHRGAGAFAFDPVGPPASTTVFDFNGLDAQYSKASSISIAAPAGAAESVVRTADLAATAPRWSEDTQKPPPTLDPSPW